LMKLLELLHNQPGLEAEALSAACGTSERTLQRDLDALGAAGFPVYFERGYRLAAPTLLPAVTLTVDQALALRVAAASTASRAEPATARTLSIASQKLEQAMAARPPEDQVERQLALPVQDAQVLPLREVERRHLLFALERAKGNRKRAAEWLGVTRRTLYRMAARHGIKLAGGDD